MTGVQTCALPIWTRAFDRKATDRAHGRAYLGGVYRRDAGDYSAAVMGYREGQIVIIIELCCMAWEKK